jgi:hypothetical protein
MKNLENLKMLGRLPLRQNKPTVAYLEEEDYDD